MTLSNSQAVVALLRMEQHIDRLEASRREPIAIVGTGARTPFEALSVSIWEGLSKGLDASRDVPADRWEPDSHAHTTKRGSFLADVQHFDAKFFALAPVEVQAMDPQQRMILETAWDALSNAGVSLDVARQVQTGVFFGVCNLNGYAMLANAAELPDGVASYVATGNAGAVIAGRVSYVLGLTGPCLVVDTACSSSLVALHLACESLRSRTSDVALAGGVSLMLSPHTTTALSNLGALSPDGRCRTFDATGSGYGRGEGCGIVVLKRLSDAVRDGDRVLAVVRGSAMNQDGSSDGLTAPNGVAQQQVIRTALEFAKIEPGDVQYVEAHGTGTVLGDPIEVEALSEVFSAAHTKASPLMIGTVKSNIGHLEAAAGITGLLKVVLSIQHRELPPSLHFQTPNPHISWERMALRVQTKLGPWPEPDKPLVAGISAFGFSGTNAHVVVSEPPAEAAEAWKEADRLAAEAQLLPLCVSAKTPDALRAYAKRFAEYLSAPLEAEATWRDVAFTSSVRRTHLEHRLVVVGANPGEWREALASLAEGERPSAVVSGDATSPVERAVFVFSGQGTQWWGMGRELLARESVFRATLEECAAYIRKHAEWSLLEELGRDEASSRLQRTDIAQPALVALQMGLVRLLESWGITPSAVVGHSVGEISAACTAGVLSLEQACHVATVRGRVMHKASGQGKMASARLSADRAEALTRDFPGRLVVGAYNGPESVVLSGEAEAVVSALALLDAQGVETKELRVDYAFHSPQMDPFKSELASALASLKPSPSRIPIVSTLTATTEAAFDASYWVKQMREPVRFVDSIGALLSSDQSLFVEVGPHPVLLASVDEIASQSSKRTVLVATLKRNEEQSRCALQTLGALHAAGYPVDWKKVFTAPGRVVSLPSYPWQRERYWLPTPRTSKGRGSDSPWALIHTHLTSSDQPGKHVFELEMGIADERLSYFSDHKVQGSLWVPGAALLEMALETGGVAFAGRTLTVEDVTFAQALMLSETESTLVQVVLQPEQAGVSAFRILSRPVSGSVAIWTAHASGRLALDRERVAEPVRATLVELQRRCTQAVPASTLYEVLDLLGVSLGPTFRGIEASWAGEGEALSKLLPIEELVEHSSGYVVHPLLLDSAFQSTLVASQGVSESNELPKRSYVPGSLGKLRVSSKAAPRWVHVKLRSHTEDAFETDIRILDDNGRVVLEVDAFRGVPVGRATDKLDDWLFEVAWRPSVSKAAASEGRWLLLADGQGVASGMRSWLEARGAEVVTVTEGSGFTKHDATHYTLSSLEPGALLRLMKEAFGKTAPNRIVHVMTLDTRASSESALDEGVLRRAQDLGCTSSLHLMQAVAQMGWSEPPRLFFVTRGCQPATGSRDVIFPEQALVWGFAATAVHEMPELGITVVDIDAATSPEALAKELASADDENRIALRGEERHVARLVRHMRPRKARGGLRPLTVGAKEGYALDVLDLGRLDSLTLQPAAVPEPGAGQVVIRTRASGISYRDVLLAQGMHSEVASGRLPIGGECAGVVHAVGDGVSAIQPGDEVVAVGLHGFDAYAVASATLVAKKSRSLSFEQAASLPRAVMTVLFGLGRVGRLEMGDRVLIHAATGGVGLAAIQYAKHVGAEIFATAGSDEERAHLRALGIAHVYDSRTVEWADEIKRDTGGRGVDVVLNSLTGDAVAKGLSVLAPFGRFVELDERNEPSSSGRRNITVGAAALDDLIRERPEASGALLAESFRLIEQGVFSPLPVESFAVSRAIQAFEHLARARHIGMVVLTAEETVAVRDPVRSDQVQSDKSYLVTGGLGGLGLVVAKRLARLGAKHLALMGRSAPSESAKATIRELEESGVHVHVVRANVAEFAEVEKALTELLRSAPAVAGLVHAAGVLDDATLSSLTATRIGPVLAPKVTGTLVLDRLLPDLGLRVYFASAAGVVGSGGQAHYAAANAFQDAFSHHLVSRSQHALSLDWGAWGEVGMAARGEVVDSVARQGLAVLAPAEGAELFERLLPSSKAQLAPIPVDFHQWRQANPRLAGMPVLRELFAESSGRSPQKNTEVLERLRAAPSAADRVGVLVEYLRITVANILRTSPEAVGGAAPFKQLGFDSLMTVGLKNTIERDLAVPISAATLFAHASIERLAAHVAEKVGSQSVVTAPPAPARSPVKVRKAKVDPPAETKPLGFAERMQLIEKELDDD